MLESFCYFSTLLLLVAGVEIRLYVSPSGSDTNNGLTLSSPLKSVQKAVSRLDDSDVAGNDVSIELTQGYHDLSQSVTLNKNYGHRVTFRAYNGQEVHVTGGKRLGNHLFHPVKDPHVLQTLPTTAHNKVLQLKLTDAGIPLTQLGHLGKFGFAVQRTAPLEVFYNGKPLRLARWPNDGSYKNVVTTPDGPRGQKFTYNYSAVGSRAQKWATEKDLWVYGFWYWDWADESAHVAKVDPSNNMITLSTKLRYGMRPGHFTLGPNSGYTSQGAYFNVFNALSELDQQGEYYVDRETGILYVWPPEHNGQVETNDIIYASLINDLFQFSNVSSVTMEDLILENCRHRAIAGDHLDNVNLQRLEIKNTGSYGIFVKSSKHVTIRQCEIHDTDGGIHIDGGERKTLTSSGNLVENNHIWSFSRAGAVGQHGISVNGVGAVLQFNHIHEGRYTGIWWLGNDHMIRKNHVHHLCTGASDCGGIHTGRDWTCRGNVIKENHIHHVLRYMPGAQVRGIMLDDQYSSVTIENNVFHDNELHMNIGGGRDNIVRHNVFYNATHAAVGVDARGISGKFSQILFQRLKAIPYTNGLWTSRYPKLARIDSEEPNLPKGNEIYQNVFYGGSSSRFVPLGGYDPADWFNVHDNYLFAKPTDFNQRRSGDYRVICQVAQWVTRKGFSQPPTLNEIGPHLSVGPAFKHSALSTKTNMPLRTNCVTTTEAPSTKILQPQVVNDGSQPNTLTDKTGCWLIIDGCPQEPELAGKRRDTEGEQHHGALTDEDACLARAAVQWRACGQSYSHTVKAVFGPTGAWTVAGQGCFMGSYGCPSHGQTNKGSLTRDGYAEAHGGLTSEAACLGRAAGQWVYCGSSLDNPIVSIFRPTGARRFAGYGCWIKVPHCPKDPTVPHMFFDAWGDTNRNTGISKENCFSRAQDYWDQCGSNSSYPVTAQFRPGGKSKTVP